MPKSLRDIDEIAKNVGAIPAHLGIPGHKPPVDFFSFSGHLEYTPVAGYKELREKIAEVYTTIYNKEIKPEEVFVTNGAIHALFVTLLSLKPLLVLPEPMFPPYRTMASVLGLRTVYYDVTGNVLETLPALVEGLRRENKNIAVVLNYPHNPTGVCLRPEEIKRLYEALKDAQAMVINDAVYYKFCYYKGELPMVGDFIVDSMSKLFAVPGLRIGFVIPPKEYREKVKIGLRATTSCLSKLAQLFAINILKNFEESYLSYLKRFYSDKREIVLKHLRQYLVRHPEGSFYAWLSSGLNSDELFLRLIRRKPKPIAIAPGRLFYSTDEPKMAFRLAYGHLSEDEIKEIKTALESLSDYVMH